MQFTGVYPSLHSAKRIAHATGLPKELTGHNHQLPSFRTFPLQKGERKKESSTSSSEKEVQASAFVEYVDDCLGEYGFSLAVDGKKHLSSIVGEVLDNAERHSDRREWWIGGYLQNRPSGELASCQVTLFNFGSTIYDSLQTLPRESLLRNEIQALIDRHTGFGSFGRSYSEEELWTLYALQAGVSRYNDEVGKIGTNGQGTADMIQFFQALGQSLDSELEPEMCLVSGQSHITFDRRYSQSEERIDGEKRRVIAFNDENDLYRPPDHRNVRRLGRYLPGTMISMRFYLDSSYLHRVTEDSNG